MIVEFSVVDTKDFTIEHLFDSPENQDLIANFQATNDAAGLEDYLKIQSVEELAPCISTPCQKKS